MRLHLSDHQFIELQKYLFDATEQVAFLLLRHTDADRAYVEEIRMLEDADYVRRDRHGAELADHVRPELIRTAHEQGYAVAEAHAHGWPGSRTRFSSTDLAGLQDLGPHMTWRLAGRPYTALVFGPDSFDALQWHPNGEVTGMDALVVGERRRYATGLSIRQLAVTTDWKVTMTEELDRYDRQLTLFGADGQRQIRVARVGLVGLGGLGAHLAQQMAYLGIRRFVLVDGKRAKIHSLNRMVTAYPGDIDEWKVELAERLIRKIQPDAEVVKVPHNLPHPEALAAITDVDLILAGLDDDAPRLLLTDLASQHRIVYIDAATDTDAANGPLVYGGRILAAGTSPGCLFCLDMLDQRQIRQATMTAEERAADAAIYGVPAGLLDETGPAVVTINGVVASLAATEAMVHLTGLRPPAKQLTYRADIGGVRPNLDEAPHSCPYCTRWAGAGPA